jgi:putative FmdB family regulatory protein
MGWKYYDFACSACGYVFEEMVRDEPEEIPCASCNEPAVRQMSAPLYGQMNDPVKKKESLMKRATSHTAREKSKGNLPSTLEGFAEFRGKKKS